MELELPEFRAYVEARQQDGTALATEDLYLACACATHVRGAIEAFHRAFGGEIEAAVARLGALAASKEDAVQIVHHRLFAGTRAKIREYRGRGALRAWVRVVAVRALLNERSSLAQKGFGSARDVETMLTAVDDPEVELMRRRYAHELREVLGATTGALGVKEQTLLRLAFVERLTVDVIGEMYGVHRATAARWIRSAQEELKRRLRATACAQLRVTPSELDSIVRMVSSALDTSLSRYFVAPG